MPFEVIETLDKLTALSSFRTSSVYELVIGIRTLFRPSRWQEDWARRTRAALPADLLEELTYLYQEFEEGKLYTELPVDYPKHDDVPGFFAYVRGMTEIEFLFYLLGRVFSEDELPRLMASGDMLRAALAPYGDHFEWYGRHIDPILADIASFRDRLVNAWERAWDAFFRAEIATLEPMWMNGISDKRLILEREGGRGLMEKVTGKADLPPAFPSGTEFTSITYTPVVLLPSPVYLFYGYGDITILFDPLYTEERKQAVEHAREESSAVLKALSHKKRLEILRLIARNDGRLHGKIIAEKTRISESAASRHLTLLKKGKLISEEPQKNLIVYRIQRETIANLANTLFDYLYG